MGLLRKEPINEIFDTVMDKATNSGFTIGSLVTDTKSKPFVAKTAKDRYIRDIIRNGSPSGDYPQQTHDGDENDSIKEDFRMSAYSAHLFQPLNETGEGNGTGVGLGVGLGTPKSDANHIFNIPINQYQDSDATFVGDGESPETSRTNIPANLAAKMARGTPHPLTVNNGINRREGKTAFKLKPLKDDFGKNG